MGGKTSSFWVQIYLGKWLQSLTKQFPREFNEITIFYGRRMPNQNIIKPFCTFNNKFYVLNKSWDQIYPGNWLQFFYGWRMPNQNTIMPFWTLPKILVCSKIISLYFGHSLTPLPPISHHSHTLVQTSPPPPLLWVRIRVKTEFASHIS